MHWLHAANVQMPRIELISILPSFVMLLSELMQVCAIFGRHFTFLPVFTSGSLYFKYFLTSATCDVNMLCCASLHDQSVYLCREFLQGYHFSG